MVKPTLSCHDAPGARNLRCLEWIRFTGTVNGSGGRRFCISSESILLYRDKLIASSWSQSEDVWLHESALDGKRNLPKVSKHKNTFVTTFMQNIIKKIGYQSYYYKCYPIFFMQNEWSSIQPPISMFKKYDLLFQLCFILLFNCCFGKY